MKNIAIIPARSGSKGLKDKNIKPLLDIPLLAYSIRAAKDSALFDEIMVSTDSDDYAQIAKDYGASVPFLRSAKTSSDTAGSWDVVTEVLSQYQTSGRWFDTICLLQPTSPLRIASDIIGGYQLFDQKNADAITAVCEMDHSPLWSMTLPPDLSLGSFRKSLSQSKRRQDLDTYYRINGALYIRKISYHANSIQLLSEKEYAYVMERGRSIDIDVAEDFELAEFLMKRSLNTYSSH